MSIPAVPAAPASPSPISQPSELQRYNFNNEEEIKEPEKKSIMSKIIDFAKNNKNALLTGGVTIGGGALGALAGESINHHLHPDILNKETALTQDLHKSQDAIAPFQDKIQDIKSNLDERLHGGMFVDTPYEDAVDDLNDEYSTKMIKYALTHGHPILAVMPESMIQSQLENEPEFQKILHDKEEALKQLKEKYTDEIIKKELGPDNFNKYKEFSTHIQKDQDALQKIHYPHDIAAKVSGGLIGAGAGLTYMLNKIKKEQEEKRKAEEEYQNQTAYMNSLGVRNTPPEQQTQYQIPGNM